MQIFHVLKPKTISKLLDASYVNQFHGFIRKRPYNFQIISFDFRLRSDSRSIKYFCGLFLIHEHVIRPYRTHQCGSKKWDHNSLLLTDCSKHIVLSITNLWTWNKVWCSEKDNKYQILLWFVLANLSFLSKFWVHCGSKSQPDQWQRQPPLHCGRKCQFSSKYYETSF